MDLGQAYSELGNAHGDFARFYGSADNLDWGVGLIVGGVAYPIYDRKEKEFSVVLGNAYILSHECDISIENDRPFNDMAVICPIIPFELALQDLNESRTAGQVRNFVNALARNSVDRAAYIPTIADVLPYGGILYLNAMSHTSVFEFNRAEVEKICSVSMFGLRYIDYSIQNSLIKRPKSQPLPLQSMGPSRGQGMDDLYSRGRSLLRRCLGRLR